MPRAKAILQSDFPYHVSARCINKEWFNIPMGDVWDIMSRQLMYVSIAYGVQIHSFVLMNNHFHLLISTPKANLSEAMWNFMSQTSTYLTEAGNRINQTYGSRHFRSVISHGHYFNHAYKYIYLNPVVAGLCERAEDYPYSTLHGLLGRRHLFIPVVEDKLLFGDTDQILTWVNRRPSDEDWGAVSLAMKRPEFKFGKDKKTKRVLTLESCEL